MWCRWKRVHERFSTVDSLLHLSQPWSTPRRHTRSQGRILRQQRPLPSYEERPHSPQTSARHRAVDHLWSGSGFVSARSKFTTSRSVGPMTTFRPMQTLTSSRRILACLDSLNCVVSPSQLDGTEPQSGPNAGRALHVAIMSTILSHALFESVCVPHFLMTRRSTLYASVGHFPPTFSTHG